MPEGDTIFRAARALNRALAGNAVVRFESVLPHLTRVHDDEPITGRTVTSVKSVGKHILMEFTGGLLIRTHMRMNGSWHIYRPGERWQRARGDMRVLVATADFEAVGFTVPVAEFITARSIERHQELRRLGPDLLGTTFDERGALGRMRGQGTRAIGEVLLNQSVMAGIGNVYKSEVLFMCRMHPFAATDSLEDEALLRLIATSRRILLANVHTTLSPMTTYTGFRQTTGRDSPQERLWVYGRAGRPCRQCGTPIAIDKRGPAARLTYWCPGCQGGR